MAGYIYRVPEVIENYLGGTTQVVEFDFLVSLDAGQMNEPRTTEIRAEALYADGSEAPIPSSRFTFTLTEQANDLFSGSVTIDFDGFNTTDLERILVFRDSDKNFNIDEGLLEIAGRTSNILLLKGILKLFRRLSEVELRAIGDIAAASIDVSLLNIEKTENGADITLQLEYDGTAVGNAITFTVGTGGVDFSDYEFHLNGTVLQLRTRTTPHTVALSVDLASLGGVALTNYEFHLNGSTLQIRLRAAPNTAVLSIDLSSIVSTGGLDDRLANVADDLTEAEQATILEKISAAWDIRLEPRDPRQLHNTTGDIDGKSFFSTRDDVISITLANNTVLDVNSSLINLRTPAIYQTDIIAWQDSAEAWYILYHASVNNVASFSNVRLTANGNTETIIFERFVDEVSVTLTGGRVVVMERYAYVADEEWDAEAPGLTFSIANWVVDGNNITTGPVAEITEPNGVVALHIIAGNDFYTAGVYYRRNGKWEHLFRTAGSTGDLAALEDHVAIIERNAAKVDGTNLRSAYRDVWRAYIGIAELLRANLSNLPAPSVVAGSIRARLMEILRGDITLADSPNLRNDSVLRVEKGPVSGKIVADSTISAPRGHSVDYNFKTPKHINDLITPDPDTADVGEFAGIGLNDSGAPIFISTAGFLSDGTLISSTDPNNRRISYNYNGVGYAWLQVGSTTTLRLAIIAKLLADTNYSIYYLGLNNEMFRHGILPANANVLDISSSGDYTFVLYRDPTGLFIGRKHRNDTAFDVHDVTGSYTHLSAVSTTELRLTVQNEGNTEFVTVTWGNADVVVSPISVELDELSQPIAGFLFFQGSTVYADGTILAVERGRLFQLDSTDGTWLTIRAANLPALTATERLRLFSKIAHNATGTNLPRRGVVRVDDTATNMILDTDIKADIESLESGKEERFRYGIRNPNRQDVVAGEGTNRATGDTTILSTSASLSAVGTDLVTNTGDNAITRNIRATQNGADIDLFFSFHFDNRPGENVLYNFIYLPLTVAGGNDAGTYPTSFDYNELNDDGSISRTLSYTRAESPVVGGNSSYNVGSGNLDAWALVYSQDGGTTHVPPVGGKFTITNVVMGSGPNAFTFTSAGVPAEPGVPGKIFRQRFSSANFKIKIEWEYTGDGTTHTWRLILDHENDGSSDLSTIEQQIQTLMTDVETLDANFRTSNANKLNRFLSNPPTPPSAVLPANRSAMIAALFHMLVEADKTAILTVFDGLTTAQLQELHTHIFATSTGLDRTSITNKLVGAVGAAKQAFRHNEDNNNLEWFTPLETPDTWSATLINNILSALGIDLAEGGAVRVLEGTESPEGTDREAVSGQRLDQYESLAFETLVAIWRAQRGTVHASEAGPVFPLIPGDHARDRYFRNNELITEVDNGTFPALPRINVSIKYQGTELEYGAIRSTGIGGNWYLILDKSRTWAASDGPSSITFTPEDGSDVVTITRNTGRGITSTQDLFIDGAWVRNNPHIWYDSLPQILDATKKYTLADSGDGDISVASPPTVGEHPIWKKVLEPKSIIYVEGDPNRQVTTIAVGDPSPTAPSPTTSGDIELAFTTHAEISGFGTGDDSTIITEENGKISFLITDLIDPNTTHHGLLLKHSNGTYTLDISGARLFTLGSFPQRFTVVDIAGNMTTFTGPSARENSIIFARPNTSYEAERITLHKTSGPDLELDKQYTFHQDVVAGAGVRVQLSSPLATEASQTGLIRPNNYLAIDTKDNNKYIAERDDNDIFSWRNITSKPTFVDEDPNALTIGAQPYRSMGDKPSYAYLGNHHEVTQDTLDNMRWQRIHAEDHQIAPGQTYYPERKVDINTSALVNRPVMIVSIYDEQSQRPGLYVFVRPFTTGLTSQGRLVDIDTGVHWSFFQTDTQADANFGQAVNAADTGGNVLWHFVDMQEDGHVVTVPSYEEYVRLYRPHERKRFRLEGFFGPMSNVEFPSEPGTELIKRNEDGTKTRLVRDSENYKTYGGTNTMTYSQSDEGAYVTKDYRSSEASASEGFAAIFVADAGTPFWMLFPSRVMGDTFKLRQQVVLGGFEHGTYTRPSLLAPSNWDLILELNSAGVITRTPTAAVLAANRFENHIIGGDITTLQLFVAAAPDTTANEDHPLWTKFTSITVTIAGTQYTLPRSSVTYDDVTVIGGYRFDIDNNAQGNAFPAVRIAFDVSSAPDIDLRGNISALTFTLNIEEGAVDFGGGTNFTARFEFVKSMGTILTEVVNRPGPVGDTHLDTTTNAVDVRFPARRIRVETQSAPHLIENDERKEIRVDHNIRNYLIETRLGSNHVYMKFDPISRGNNPNYRPGEKWVFRRLGEQWLATAGTTTTSGRVINLPGHGFYTQTPLVANRDVGSVSSGTVMWVRDVGDHTITLVDSRDKLHTTGTADLIDPSNIDTFTTFTPRTATVRIELSPENHIFLHNHWEALTVMFVSDDQGFIVIPEDVSGYGRFSHLDAPGTNPFSGTREVAGFWARTKAGVNIRASAEISAGHNLQVGDLEDHHLTLPFGLTVGSAFDRLFIDNPGSSLVNRNVTLPVGKLHYQRASQLQAMWTMEMQIASNQRGQIIPVPGSLEGGSGDPETGNALASGDTFNINIDLPYTNTRRW